MNIQLSLAVVLALFALPNEAYRILCLFPFNGRSHFIMFGALCRGLAKKGHQVDVVSHFPSEVPRANYTDIVNLKGTMPAVVNSFSIDTAVSLNSDLVYKISTQFGADYCRLMGTEPMQKFIKNPGKYDVILTEYFGANCYFGFGLYLNTPIIGVISALDPPYLNERIGNPLSNAFYSGCYTADASLKTFWARLENTMTNFISGRTFNHYILEQTEIMRQYLGKDLPDVITAESTMALTLVNTHWSFHGVRPLTPSLIQVAGLHCEDDETVLPPELETWMDNAKSGVVYFTLGSLVKIETLPKEALLGIYKSFAKLAPTKILMKIANADELPPGLPDNVLTLPWMPQIPVLRHKNTKVFITHGGLMGSQEAILFGVPIIGIALFADQIRNINTFVEKRIGVALKYDNISEESMDEALDAVLNDPIYRITAKKESAIFKDQPLSPMNTAIFWIEYISRNGGRSLRSPASDMPWWQLYLVDIYAFLLALVILSLYLIVTVTKMVVCCLRKFLRTVSPKKPVKNAMYRKQD